MKKEPKQILNKELIKIDLKQAIKNNLIISIVGLFITLVAVIFITLASIQFGFFSFDFVTQNLKQFFDFLLFGLMCLCVMHFLTATINNIKRHSKINRGDFKIEIDTLLNTESFMFARFTNAVLRFLRYKPFGFSKAETYYKWSQKRSMKGFDLFETSVREDKFYIVSFNGKTPIMVYNTRFFDYKAEQEQDL